MAVTADCLYVLLSVMSEFSALLSVMSEFSARWPSVVIRGTRG